MESNARFVIGAGLVDPEADPLEIVIRQDLMGEKRVGVQVPRQLLLDLGAAGLAERVADYYLHQFPEEAERLDRESVVRAIQRGIEWRITPPEDDEFPEPKQPDA